MRTALMPTMPAPSTVTRPRFTPGTPPTSRPLPPRFFWRSVTPIWAARRPATSLIGASTGKEPSSFWIVS